MMNDEQLTRQLVDEFESILSLDLESFEMLRMASRDEINRSMDGDDLVGELRGRYLQAMCDAVARYR